MTFLSMVIVVGFFLLVCLAIWHVLVAPKKRADILWKRLVRKYRLSPIGGVYTGVIQERRLTLQKNPFTIETTPIAPKGLRVVITKDLMIPASGLSAVSVPTLDNSVVKSNKPLLAKKLFTTTIIQQLNTLPLFAITIDGSMTLQTKSDCSEQLENYITTSILCAQQLERLR